jgi:hypothetical protein
MNELWKQLEELLRQIGPALSRSTWPRRPGVNTRRMHDTAAHLVDRVLPTHHIANGSTRSRSALACSWPAIPRADRHSPEACLHHNRSGPYGQARGEQKASR